MRDIRETDDGAIRVSSGDTALDFRPYAVTLSDGTEIVHESRGGTLSSVAAHAVGEHFVEIAHLGDGPEGGELVMTITLSGDPTTTYVCLGALWTDDIPAQVRPSWPVAVDLALGLIGPGAILIGPSVEKEQVEELHQLLLGALHG